MQDLVVKITSEIRDSVFQSYLVSSSGLDAVTISKLCSELENQGLVVRKEIVQKGKGDYRIKPSNEVNYEKIKEAVSKYLSVDL